MIVYTSPFQDCPILNTSIFTRLFSARSDASDDIGGFPGSAPAFVDAATGTSITRAELMHLCLSLAYGLKHHHNTSSFANRGDVVLIYSPNSLAWPVVLFGCACLFSVFRDRLLKYRVQPLQPAYAAPSRIAHTQATNWHTNTATAEPS